MAKAKVAPATTEAMQVDDRDPPVDSEHELEEPLRKKRPNPFKQYYPNKMVDQELDRLRQKVERLKSERKIYKTSMEWILGNIGNHTIAHNVAIGYGNVIVDKGEGEKEDMKIIMAKHFKKVTCEHASISKELATLKNIVQMSSKTLHPMSKKSDKKLESLLELLEMTLQPDFDFAIKIDRALTGIQKWSEDSKRTLQDMYKATCEQAPRDALALIQFLASKCVGVHSRETLKRVFNIDRHAIEDDPTDQNLCFRGLIFWRQKDPENNNAKQLQQLLKELDSIILEEREQEAELVLKLNKADVRMEGVGEQSFTRMYRNVEETLAHVTSIAQKLATTEQRQILDVLQPDTSVIGPSTEQSTAEVRRRVRSLSVDPPNPPKKSRSGKH